MANVFDQFDTMHAGANARAAGNPFDRFDQPRAGTPRYPAPRRGQDERAPSFLDEYYNALRAVIPQPGDDLSPTAQALGAFVSKGTDSIPIAGPYITDAMHSLFANTQADRLGKSEDEVRGTTERLTGNLIDKHPVAATAGGVTGAVAGTMPAMLMAPEAFGAGAGALGGRIAAGVISGGTLGGVDAAVRNGGDPDGTALGALGGAAAGGLGPLVGKAVGGAYRGVADWLAQRGIAKVSDLTPAAVRMLHKALEADGIAPAAVQQRLSQLGPEAMLADLGPNTQQMAAGLVAMPGEARATVQNAVRARDVGANQRIRSTLDDTLGPAPVPRRVDAALEANQRDVGPHYRQVFQDAQPVNTAPIARYLDREITTLRGEAQRGVTRIREMLNRVGTEELEANPVVLLETRKAVDGMLETVQDSNARNALQTARQAIDDELRRSVRGIKEADAKFAELARQREGLQRGQTVLASGRESPRPVELAEEFQQGALPQGEMVGPSAVPLRMRQGARAEIDRIVGTTANDRKALQTAVKGDGDWNRARLATLYGQERADRLVSLLDAERAFADTSNFVTRNSATAARQQAVHILGGQSSDGFGAREAFMAGGTRGAARAAGLTAVERVFAALNAGDRSAMARGLVSGHHSPIVQALVERAGRAPIRPQTISQITQALLVGPGAALASGR